MTPVSGHPKPASIPDPHRSPAAAAEATGSSAGPEC